MPYWRTFTHDDMVIALFLPKGNNDPLPKKVAMNRFPDITRLDMLWTSTVLNAKLEEHTLHITLLSGRPFDRAGKLLIARLPPKPKAGCIELGDGTRLDEFSSQLLPRYAKSGNYLHLKDLR